MGVGHYPRTSLVRDYISETNAKLACINWRCLHTLATPAKLACRQATCNHHCRPWLCFHPPAAGLSRCMPKGLATSHLRALRCARYAWNLLPPATHMYALLGRQKPLWSAGAPEIHCPRTPEVRRPTRRLHFSSFRLSKNGTKNLVLNPRRVCPCLGFCPPCLSEPDLHHLHPTSS